MCTCYFCLIYFLPRSFMRQTFISVVAPAVVSSRRPRSTSRDSPSAGRRASSRAKLMPATSSSSGNDTCGTMVTSDPRGVVWERA